MLRLYTHPACLQHDNGPGHPESPARLAAVLRVLDHDRYAALDRVEAPRASREQLLRVHDVNHVDRILTAIPVGQVQRLDEDTVLDGGHVRRAFCAVRPPGHHATREQAMGFCLFNNVAVAAAHALAAHGLQRVAIADFDVHHGNGTQDIFWREPRVLFASSHQMPLYPGSGGPDERGAGNILNRPLSAGDGPYLFRELWEGDLLPRLHAFKPQLVLVSAGFDAHQRDPLADLCLGSEDYAWITAKLVELANRHADGRLVSTLEGGYDLAALAASTAAHVEAMLD